MKFVTVCIPLSLLFSVITAAKARDSPLFSMQEEFKKNFDDKRSDLRGRESYLERTEEDLLEEEEALLESILERSVPDGHMGCFRKSGSYSKTIDGYRLSFNSVVRKCSERCNPTSYDYFALEKDDRNDNYDCMCLRRLPNRSNRLLRDLCRNRETRQSSSGMMDVFENDSRPVGDDDDDDDSDDDDDNDGDDDDDDSNGNGRGDYLGCYRDGANDRNLERKVNTNGYLTVNSCINRCRDQRYDFAGVAKSGGECWCGDRNNNRKANNSRDCERISDRGGYAGGDRVISVYRL